VIERHPFNQLFLIMATATLLVSAVSIISLYNAAIEQHRLHLVETVKSQARLIESIAQFDLQRKNNISGYDQLALLEKIIEAQSGYKDFGETGEFVLAQRQGDQIEFLLQFRHSQPEPLKTIPLKGNFAEPMRRALAGESGVVKRAEYQGQ